MRLAEYGTCYRYEQSGELFGLMRVRSLTLGSYSYWKVGQYTRFVGIEGRQEGNCHFAGEHTSLDSQGCLNGAVESGERAASEVLSDIR